MSGASLVDGLAMSATAALFDTYGVKVEQEGRVASRRLRSAPLVSSIGFSSPGLSGSLILALPYAVAERTLPAPGASLDDWSGELANQLLGRLKNQLLKYQVTIDMSLPTLVTEEGLEHLATKRKNTTYNSFTSELGKLFVCLDLNLSSTLQFVETEADDSVAVDEGELLLF